MQTWQSSAFAARVPPKKNMKYFNFRPTQCVAVPPSKYNIILKNQPKKIIISPYWNRQTSDTSSFFAAGGHLICAAHSAKKSVHWRKLIMSNALYASIACIAMPNSHWTLCAKNTPSILWKMIIHIKKNWKKNYYSKFSSHFFFAGRTPDSPESIRAVAPRSPISPKAQYTNLTLQRTTNGSTSPIQKGGSTTPPQQSSAASTPLAATPIQLTDASKEINKLRKFLGALYQFGQDTSTECGDRVRSLILSLVVSCHISFNSFFTRQSNVITDHILHSLQSGGLSTEAFKQALQESVNFPLRPYVLPFLKSHIPALKRDLANLAKASNQVTFDSVNIHQNNKLIWIAILVDFTVYSGEWIECVWNSQYVGWELVIGHFYIKRKCQKWKRSPSTVKWKFKTTFETSHIRRVWLIIHILHTIIKFTLGHFFLLTIFAFWSLQNLRSSKWSTRMVRLHASTEAFAYYDEFIYSQRSFIYQLS